MSEWDASRISLLSKVQDENETLRAEVDRITSLIADRDKLIVAVVGRAETAEARLDVAKLQGISECISIIKDRKSWLGIKGETHLEQLCDFLINEITAPTEQAAQGGRQ